MPIGSPRHGADIRLAASAIGTLCADNGSTTMDIVNPRSTVHLTAAARAAAAQLRDSKAAAPQTMRGLGIFVVRRPAPSKLFGWELRRFGNFVVERSHVGFETTQGAHAAGDERMARRLLGPPEVHDGP